MRAFEEADKHSGDPRSGACGPTRGRSNWELIRRRSKLDRLASKRPDSQQLYFLWGLLAVPLRKPTWRWAPAGWPQAHRKSRMARASRALASTRPTLTSAHVCLWCARGCAAGPAGHCDRHRHRGSLAAAGAGCWGRRARRRSGKCRHEPLPLWRATWGPAHLRRALCCM